MNLPDFYTQHVFFANGSENDLLLFQHAVNELPYVVHLSTATNGEEAISILNQLASLPDLLCFDLDLPVKNGLECLQEVKANKELASVPVIIFSTSSHPSVINQAYEAGAHLYICQSGEDVAGFGRLIQYVLSINWKGKIAQPPREEFVLAL